MRTLVCFSLMGYFETIVDPEKERPCLPVFSFTEDLDIRSKLCMKGRVPKW